MTDSKDWIQDQLGYPSKNTTCTDKNSSPQGFKASRLFSKDQWKFDDPDFKKIRGAFPLSSKANLLSLATVSQHLWNVYCLLCDGKYQNSSIVSISHLGFVDH